MLKKICLKIVPHKLLHKTTTLTFKQHMGQSCPIKCKVHAFHVKGKPLFCNRHLTFKKQIFKYQFILLNSKAKPLLPLQVLVACSRVTFTNSITFVLVNSYATGQEIPRSLWISQGSLPCSQQPPGDRILNQINPIRTLPSYLCKVHFSIILHSVHRPSKLSVILTCHMLRPSHPP